MPVEYTDLVTVQQVVDSLVESFPTQKQTDIENAVTRLHADVVRRIHRATDRIEFYLDRTLIVRPKVLRFATSDWEQCEGYNNPDDALKFLAWADHFPVVEVYAVNGTAADAGNIEIFDNATRVGYDPDVLIGDQPTNINAYCGYRREDQGVGTPGSGDSWTENLQLESGLSGLTEDPPLLPYDIVGVCLNAVVGPLRIALQGLVGIRQVDVEIGDNKISTKLPDLKLDERELAKISYHRFES